MVSPEPARPAPPPTQGTTIGAAVVSLIAGLFAAGGALSLLVITTGSFGEYLTTPMLLVVFLAEVASCACLLVGSAMLFGRRTAGRPLVVIGAVLVLALALQRGFTMMDTKFGAIGLLGIMMSPGLWLAIAAAVLVTLPSTAAWLATKEQ